MGGERVLVALRMFGLDILELTVVTDHDADEVDVVQGMGSVESLHVADGVGEWGEAGFSR